MEDLHYPSFAVSPSGNIVLELTLAQAEVLLVAAEKGAEGGVLSSPVGVAVPLMVLNRAIQWARSIIALDPEEHIPLSDTDIQPRIIKALDAEGIKTVAGLRATPRKELRLIKNVGTKGVNSGLFGEPL